MDSDADLLLAMSRDAVQAGGAAVDELRVEGGACVNDSPTQLQADVLGIPVVRPTALGTAYLAGLATGVFQGADERNALRQPERRFRPSMSPEPAPSGWRSGNMRFGRPCCDLLRMTAMHGAQLE